MANTRPHIPALRAEPSKTERLRIVVGGFVGLWSAGGVTWDYLQYPLGFAALGHDVYYIEDTCIWPVFQKENPGDCTANVRRLAAVMRDFGLEDRWAYRDIVTDRWFGLSAERVGEVCRSADLFVNISCSTYLCDRYRDIPTRVLIDSDPMFTQIQCRTGVGLTRRSSGLLDKVQEHTHHFTFGENVGQRDCLVPECGVRWRPTRQPICLAHWPVRPPPTVPDAAFTTLMNWSVCEPLVYDGRQWGQKDTEFRKIMTLPSRAGGVPLAVAVTQTTGEQFPTREAEAAGWRVLDPTLCAPDWRRYRDFIYGSLGEFSVAKHTYVAANTGWFSCRSACYLAAGRPAVVQDTGWTRHIPAGEGVLAFHDLDSAADALGRVVADFPRHARAARRIAEDYFDARRVLGELIRQASATPMRIEA